jgi:uncharacterized protein (UPF0548 family)
MHSTDDQAVCDRWVRRVETDSLAGTDGVVDHYARSIDVPTDVDPAVWFERLEERLLTYQVFPPEIMRAQVCSADARLREGTTIVQRVAIGPLTLEAGVRIIRVWQDREPGGAETGFTYTTLQGHPERGVSSFRLRRNADATSIDFLIDVRSRPGSWLTRLTRPVARRFQIRATEAALAYVTSPRRP